jgi:hypothetical protein
MIESPLDGGFQIPSTRPSESIPVSLNHGDAFMAGHTNQHTFCSVLVAVIKRLGYRIVLAIPPGPVKLGRALYASQRKPCQSFRRNQEGNGAHQYADA